MKYFLLLLPFITLSQEFKFSPEGIDDYFVIEYKMNQQQIYDKTKLWIYDSFVDPEEVIKVDIEKEKVRIRASYENHIYQFEISFKDGRAKFDPIQLQRLQGGYTYNIPFGASRYYFKKNGKSKYMLEPNREATEAILNTPLNSWIAYLTTENKEDDW